MIHNRAECDGLGLGKLGEDLAVQLNTSFRQLAHEARIVRAQFAAKQVGKEKAEGGVGKRGKDDVEREALAKVSPIEKDFRADRS